MLARLRHDAVVGRHDEQREIYAGRAGEHGVHEALVARHIDEADDVPRRARQISKAQFDGDAAAPLLLQAVGIDACQCAHEARLAVIDVAGGADDHGVASASGRRRASSLPASISAGDKVAKTGLRKRSASLLPPQRARMSQAYAFTRSFGTPWPI